MSVELLDSPRFHGYRVRRQIEGKTYQEYFSLVDNGKRLRGARRQAVKEAAQTRDAHLSKLQKQAKDKSAKQIHVDRHGQIRGILCRLKDEKSGTKTPVFQIGVMSMLDNKIVNTTVSINRHGREEAWRRAIDFYAKHKKISKRSKAYKELEKALPSAAKIDRLIRQARRPKRRRRS